MTRLRPGSPLAFGLVGAVGFLVDAAVLSLLHETLGPYVARGFSFLVAVTVTWLLNRTWVFKVAEKTAAEKRREYRSYVLVQTAGVGINLGVYVLLLSLFQNLHEMPVVPLAAGSAVAMFFNYAGARLWVCG